MFAKTTASIGAAIALAVPATVGAAHTHRPLSGRGTGARAHQVRIGRCTMAVPPLGSTLEVEIANAPDFCELVSHALAGDVFRAPVAVTPGLLWHYARAEVSCRLRYAATAFQITVRNSAATCRWFGRLAPDWHP
jgi:hypothetical protein